jgi:hypothetical protein
MQTAQTGRVPGALDYPNDIHWAHHFVIFMFQDVAMPDVHVTMSRNYLRRLKILMYGTGWRLIRLKNVTSKSKMERRHQES